MAKVYAVIGAGRQGLASAYDFVINGNAEKVIIADNNFEAATVSAQKINSLTKTNLCTPVQADASDIKEIAALLKNVDAFVSAVPYKFNLGLTNAAIQSNTHMTDLGGNTGVVKNQMKLSPEAENAGISVVPDCGMDPGLNISLIMFLFNKFDEVEEIKSYGAGLPQNPVPPWNYELYFNLNGLTNEYYGNAVLIINGKVSEVPCFDLFEELVFPDPLGKLEAAVTSGGLSTLPWELEGKVKTLTNKTLRYPGHWEKFKAFSELGLFEESPVKVNNCEISPRDFYHKLLAPKIQPRSNKDVGIIKIIATGTKNGKRKTIEAILVDYFDDLTGFTSMQRLTGWHASAIAIMAAEGNLTPGVHPVGTVLPGRVVSGIIKRGIKIDIRESEN